MTIEDRHNVNVPLRDTIYRLLCAMANDSHQTPEIMIAGIIETVLIEDYLAHQDFELVPLQ